MRAPSKHEIAFKQLWERLNGPELVEEFRFHPVRKWRFDFAHLPSRCAFELEGATWANGRHNRGDGIEKDMEKYNEAAMAGWRVFRMTGRMISEELLLDLIEQCSFARPVDMTCKWTKGSLE